MGSFLDESLIFKSIDIMCKHRPDVWTEAPIQIEHLISYDRSGIMCVNPILQQPTPHNAH